MDRRVKFDFEIEFTNGGGIQGQDFRLDIQGEDISDAALADHLAADMRLLMVGAVKILNKSILLEPHKRRPISHGAEAGRLVELSHVIEHGLITHKGLPAPVICDYLSREASRERYAPGTEFHIAKFEMVANTGTYLDCPYHRYAHGKDLAKVGAEAFTDLEGIVVRADATARMAIDIGAFRDRELRNRAVLVHTGWDRHWGTEAYFEHPFLTGEAAEYLKACGVRLVGIDAMNIDDTRGDTRPVHSTLLGADILIVEHLCHLDGLPDEGFTFSAMPPRIKGAGTFPVRAVGKLKVVSEREEDRPEEPASPKG